MAKDREFSTNDEVQRGGEFQKKVTLKENVLDIVEELLISTTKSCFEKAGYKHNDKNDKFAGVYGNETNYGAGVGENQFSINLAHQTKSFFTKKVILGTKTVISVLNIAFNDTVVEFEYKSPESGFFRGVDSQGKTYMVNEKFTIAASNLEEMKTQLKKQFDLYAKKELGYLVNTKLGVDDKTEKSTTSVVESLNKEFTMKKLSIKDMFTEGLGMNSDKIRDLNTRDLEDTTPPIEGAGDKQLFFDDSMNETGEWSDDEEGIAWKETLKNQLDSIAAATNMVVKGVQGFDKYQGPYGVVEINGATYKVWTTEHDALYIENYPISNSSENENPGFTGSVEDIIEVINTGQAPQEFNSMMPGTNSMGAGGFSVNEISASGPPISGSEGGYKDGAQSGAGGYNTPYAWKKTSYAKGQQKRPKITKEWNVVSQDEKSDKPESNEKPKGEKEKTTPFNKTEKAPEKSKSGNNTEVTEKSSSKGGGVVEPKDKTNSDPKSNNTNWQDANQKNAPSSDKDGFWTEVELEPGTGYVPKGMKQNFVAGMHNASQADLKKRGYAENKNANGEVVNELHQQNAKKLIDHFGNNIRHAEKNNNFNEANKLKLELKKRLENASYNWKQDPYALEVLGDMNNAFSGNDNNPKATMTSMFNENKESKLLKENTANNILNDSQTTQNSHKRKFFNLSENTEKGINKRYLVTEKTTDEFEKERWKRLTSFKTYETIKEAEELNSYFDTLHENKDFSNPVYNRPLLTEAVDENLSSFDAPVQNQDPSEDTVMVEKPTSKFGTPYKFFKKDFLNESKKYILDLNSRMFVANPNAK